MRSDSAGATHAFADACRAVGVGFSFGYAVDTRVQDAVEVLNRTEGWYPAIDADGDIRDGAWVAEATALVEMSSWPAGTRLILRKERPHPGAQLRFTHSDGRRVTAFIWRDGDMAAADASAASVQTESRCGPGGCFAAGAEPPRSCCPPRCSHAGRTPPR